MMTVVLEMSMYHCNYIFNFQRKEEFLGEISGGVAININEQVVGKVEKKDRKLILYSPTPSNTPPCTLSLLPDGQIVEESTLRVVRFVEWFSRENVSSLSFSNISVVRPYLWVFIIFRHTVKIIDPSSKPFRSSFNH